MKRLARVGFLVATIAVCACATPARTREATFLRDASECEEDADRQLRIAGQSDNTVRILFFQSCMMLRGWRAE